MSYLIDQNAIRDFLNEPRDDWDWMKKLSWAELRGILKTFHPPPNFKLKPRKAQLVSFILGIMFEQFLFLLDAGRGKTKIILDVLQYRKRLGQDITSLVVVPNVVNMDNWVEEVEIHTPELKIIPLLGSSKERWKIWEEETNADLYVINFGGLQAMVATLAHKGRSGKRGRVKDQKLISKIGKRIHSLVIDECHNCKNHQSVNFSVLSALAKFVDIRYGSTGTPFGKNPMDLWAQFKLIDGGITLNSSIGVFQQAFFNEHFNGWGYEWKFDRRKISRLNRIIRHRSIRYAAAKDRNNTNLKVQVRISRTAAKYYDQVIEQAIAVADEDIKETKNSFIRMRQIASGFIGMHGDETGTKFEIAFPQNPKLDAMMQLIDEFPESDKVIIFHEYVYTGILAAKRIKKASIKHVTLNGTMTKTEDKRRAIKVFKTDPSVRILVVNWQSGGAGLNLQIANRAIFVESPTSPISRRQAYRRIVRMGQKKHTYIYDIVARTPTDERILEALAEGHDLQESLLGRRSKSRKNGLASLRLQSDRSRILI